MKRMVIFLLPFFLAVFTTAAQQSELRKSIYFDGGSYEIDDEQIQILSRWLDSVPNLLDKYEIELISHTDPIGGREYNEWLSKMRSQMVFDILIQKDIPERYIHSKDWAFQNPVYSNKTYEGMVRNRRVDVILYPVVF